MRTGSGVADGRPVAEDRQGQERDGDRPAGQDAREGDRRGQAEGLHGQRRGIGPGERPQHHRLARRAAVPLVQRDGQSQGGKRQEAQDQQATASARAAAARPSAP